MSEYIMTLDSDDEDVPQTKKAVKEDDDLNPDFVFDLADDTYADILNNGATTQDLVKTGSKATPISVDEIIARRRLSLKRKRNLGGEPESDSGSDEEDDGSEGDDSEEEGEDEDEGSEGGESDGEGVEVEDMEEADPLASSEEEDDEEADNPDGSEDGFMDEDSSDEEEEETEADKARKKAFFAAEEEATGSTHDSFLSMNLSRPLLKAITSLGFSKPTPIQAATIPVALLGKDVVGNAVTGSGKTAAFMIPMLERLLYRDKGKKAAATRCLVLLPTRELAVQCFEVGKKLASHTDVQLCLLVGGLSLKSQEAVLRTRPDIVLATPGRLIDHIRNSPGFTLDAIDILVLDEADRMLSDGFHDELTEIINSCPKSRQTMLFSATMTDSVDELIKMSLNKPVRLFVDPKRSTARGLIQEFVRVRKENERSAVLAALCKQTFKKKVIIFVGSKKLAHQMRIVFSLLDMKCEELHGDLSQEQRLNALQAFRDGSVDYLMATDLASRGLDIKGVETVINYDMPNQLAQYLHRVGRTARAGKRGRSVTLVGEADRRMLKAAIKHAAGEDQVRQRSVPAEVAQKYIEKLEGLKGEIMEVMEEEKMDKQLRRAEMELKKGENLIEHETEIFSRPARTWFQSEKEKLKAKEISKASHESSGKAAKGSSQKKGAAEEKPKRDKFAGLSRRMKRRKLAAEEDKEEGIDRAVGAAIRSAKKAARPSKIGQTPSKPSSTPTKSRGGKKSTKKGGSFDSDFGSRSKSHEGVRAVKGTKPNLNKKGKGVKDGKKKGKK
ncbi:hypothetical protein D9611_006832 [Ephemerocybe angulata]|uniref:Uncharacterized protein n=2 Tax=Ephemerocybe angulata TaxID=980116 RepID=A0A8H5AZP9_9AGAR|nr:hypothetical protein D9611_006832 [Tulosesus angulatus]KAF6766010.1 DEAD-domain-containing protein [Tulosesus angulatus]